MSILQQKVTMFSIWIVPWNSFMFSSFYALDSTSSFFGWVKKCKIRRKTFEIIPKKFLHSVCFGKNYFVFLADSGTIMTATQEYLPCLTASVACSERGSSGNPQCANTRYNNVTIRHITILFLAYFAGRCTIDMIHPRWLMLLEAVTHAVIVNWTVPDWLGIYRRRL